MIEPEENELLVDDKEWDNDTPNSITVEEQVDGQLVRAQDWKGGEKAKGHFEDVAFERIYLDKEFNVRDIDAYELQQLHDLDASLRTFGLETPLVVSKKSDGRMKILKGHRRFECLVQQRKEGLPWNRVKCEVKEGLTDADEVLVMLDHSLVKGLNRHETWKAVQRLATIPGMSDVAICAKLGMTKSVLQVHLKIAKLPHDVQQAYGAYLRGEKTAPRLTAGAVNALFEAQMEDRRAGGVQFGGGPRFRQAWQELQGQVGSVRTKSEATRKLVQDLLSKRLADPSTGHILLFQFCKHLLGESQGLPLLQDVIEEMITALRRESSQ